MDRTIIKTGNIHFSGLCLLVSLCFSISAQAQEPRPDRPVIERVSVHPHTGYITVEWDVAKPQVSQIPVEEFELFWLEEEQIGTATQTTNHAFARITDPATRSYTFDYDTVAIRLPTMPDPRKTSVPFTVAAINRSYSNSLRSVSAYNIQLKSDYDSCKAEIRLNWAPYRYWDASTQPFQPLISYHLMSIDEGGQEVEEAVFTEKDNSYTVRNVQENDRYAYYVIAKRNDGVTATCYKTEIDTKMPVQPAFIDAVSTQYNDQGHAQISFRIDPGAQIHSYELSGSSRHDYSFVSLGTFNIYRDTVLTDPQIRNRTYYYMLEAWHLCRNRFIEPSSNTATALWMSLEQSGQTNTIRWDPYVSWGSDTRYELHRKIGNSPDEIIATVTDPDDTFSADDLSGKGIEEEICYWVSAAPASGADGRFAVSNSVCIQPESEIFIPTAFTPNGDGKNDEYKPSFTYPPQEYIIHLYDRTGAKIFETTDFNAGWNGLLTNGKPASEGVYVYYLTYRTAIGRLIERRGTFVLILP